ncbi:MAG: MOSC domain-containing protein [Leptolyngbyaceae cyanobacterium SM2_5_2]|nr:MOSC domain-containing protein [Leptolyngbyaceae cyanobacterium SM2_5_2]
MTRTFVGTVKALWRYPVKSMRGEQIATSTLTQRGFFGDRAYALWDEQTQKVASAKNPKKWAQLLGYQARLLNSTANGETSPEVEISLPDGQSTNSSSTEVNTLLSTVLGRPVRLISAVPDQASIEHYWPEVEGTKYQDTITQIVMPTGTFFDACHVHAISTATLARLKELSPASTFDVRRFRPNLVIQPVGDRFGFVEDAWVNHTLAIGETARLDAFTGCPRCVMTTLPQSELPADLDILRTTAQHNQVIAGIRATVLQGGLIRQGDPIWIEKPPV